MSVMNVNQLGGLEAPQCCPKHAEVHDLGQILTNKVKRCKKCSNALLLRGQ